MSSEQHTEQKWCPRCKNPKSIDDFGRNKKHSDGLQSWCKKCNNEYNRQRYKKNPEPAKKRADKYYQKNREKCIDSQRKRRQKKRQKKQGFSDLPAQIASWRGPPVKIYTKEERKELERKIRQENPEAIPKDWYKILPAAAKKFLEEYPVVKKALKKHYVDGADFTFINHLRRHLYKYRHLTEHQIDKVIAISQDKEQL